MYLNIAEMALRFRVSQGEIQRAVNLNVLPAPIRVGKKNKRWPKSVLRWPLSAIEAWEREAFAEAQTNYPVSASGVLPGSPDAELVSNL